MGQQSLQSRDAPSIVRLTKNVPVVDGVTPKLPLRAEVIGRDTGDDAWPALLVQQKQLRVGPDVARVGRNKKGQIADQAYALAKSVHLEPFALAEQQELREAYQVNLICQFGSNLVECCRFPLNQFCWPFKVICAAEPNLDRSEQRIVL